MNFKHVMTELLTHRLLMWLLAWTATTLAAGTVVGDDAETMRWDSVTVVTLAGWEYQNVGVEVKRGNSAISIVKSDDARREMELSNIKAIIDKQGNNILPAVYESAGVTDSPKATTKSPAGAQATSNWQDGENVPVTNRQYFSDPRRLRGARFRVAFSGSGGMGDIGGDWFTGLSGGMSYGFDMRIMLTDNMYIGSVYRYQSISVDPEYQEMLAYDEFGNLIGTILTDNWSLGEMFFVLGYTTTPSRYTQPFAYFDMGLGSVKHKSRVTLVQDDGQESTVVKMGKLGLLMTVGGVIPVNRSLGFNLSGNMILTGQSQQDSYAASSGLVYWIGAGLCLMLGK